MLKVFLAGTGWPLPDPDRAELGIVVMVDEEPLLLDCGWRVVPNIVRCGINPLLINHVFLTHLDTDHVSDLPPFVFFSWNFGRGEYPGSKILKIFGPKPTKYWIDNVLNVADKYRLEGYKRFLASLPSSVKRRQVLEQPIEVFEIEEGLVYQTEKWKVTCAVVQHANEYKAGECYAFRVDTKYGSIAYSGDTQPCENMVRLAKDVDLLIHEAAFLDEIIRERKMTGHSGPTGAGEVARDARAKKLAVVHLPPFASKRNVVLDMASIYLGSWHGPEVLAKVVTDIRKNYDGPLIIGEDCMEIPVP